MTAGASSREAVLAAIRRAGVAPEDAPDAWRSNGGSVPDPAERFASALELAGGAACFLARDELPRRLAEHAERLGAVRLHSTLPELPSRYAGPAPSAPRDLARLDLAMTRGGPAVAESGAVWLAPADTLTRAACLLAEHLVLVVAADRIVSDLHQAYAVIDPAASPFGCFVAGPSKTADIEQVLVVGAHGARSLTVFVTR